MENRKWGVRIMEAKKYRRIFTIVVDSCGIGGAKDAERFGEVGLILPVAVITLME